MSESRERHQLSLVDKSKMEFENVQVDFIRIDGDVSGGSGGGDGSCQ